LKKISRGSAVVVAITLVDTGIFPGQVYLKRIWGIKTDNSNTAEGKALLSIHLKDLNLCSSVFRAAIFGRVIFERNGKTVAFVP